MSTVTVSPKFQVVIPKELREQLRLKPGQKLLVYAHHGSLHLVPPKSLKEMRGLAEGIRWEEGDRDRNDRF
jgi:AbrB family looped-hinge helix DNA binding protein